MGRERCLVPRSDWSVPFGPLASIFLFLWFRWVHCPVSIGRTITLALLQHGLCVFLATPTSRFPPVSPLFLFLVRAFSCFNSLRIPFQCSPPSPSSQLQIVHFPSFLFPPRGFHGAPLGFLPLFVKDYFRLHFPFPPVGTQEFPPLSVKITPCFVPPPSRPTRILSHLHPPLQFFVLFPLGFFLFPSSSFEGLLLPRSFEQQDVNPFRLHAAAVLFCPRPFFSQSGGFGALPVPT